MGKIKRLPVHVANQIAAGEVVERPASVVKELLENALDARADTIEVRLHEGGRSLIEVRDHGEGFSRSDLELSIAPHATSKLFNEEDLSSISTLGFRGEALASISAVSRLTITSRTGDESEGWRLSVSFGKDVKMIPAGCAAGTVVQVRDLFLEVPARQKFLKSRQTELARCLKIIRSFAVGWPEVSFVVRNERRQIFRNSRDARDVQRLEPLFGTEILSSMKRISGEGEGTRLEGFIASPEEARLSSRHMYFFLNRRLITSPVLWRAVNEALRGRLVRGNYPAGVIFLEMEPELVDVNMHPSKSEVRFQKPDGVYRLVYHGVKRALSSREGTVEQERICPAEKGEGYTLQAEQLSSGRQEANREHVAQEVPLPWQEKGEEKGEAEVSIMEGQISGDSWTPPPETRLLSGRKLSAATSEGKGTSGENQNEIRIIGQFSESFILAETAGRLLIFDQHAAHEGLLFRRLFREFEKEGGIRKEPLMFPHVMEVDLEMMEGLGNASAVLEELGIDVSDFGDSQVIIRSVPYILAGAGDSLNVAEGIVGDLLSNPGRTRQEALRRLISRIACSMAVKANSRLHRDQMASLVDDCLKEGVTNCPHGRPIMRQITISELCRDFFRQ